VFARGFALSRRPGPAPAVLALLTAGSSPVTLSGRRVVSVPVPPAAAPRAADHPEGFLATALPVADARAAVRRAVDLARGLRPSDGERQCLARARVFLKDAPALLLDEPDQRRRYRDHGGDGTADVRSRLYPHFPPRDPADPV
jgi:hypothetical protein